jgi:hypothetical protein
MQQQGNLTEAVTEGETSGVATNQHIDSCISETNNRREIFVEEISFKI